MKLYLLCFLDAGTGNGGTGGTGGTTTCAAGRTGSNCETSR